ncbi:hypothetical protein Ddye_020126, partial [Dipteronia dyeriana]
MGISVFDDRMIMYCCSSNVVCQVKLTSLKQSRHFLVAWISDWPILSLSARKFEALCLGGLQVYKINTCLLPIELGAVVHDWQGVVLPSASKCLHAGLSPEMAEAAAVAYGLKFALDVVKLLNDGSVPFADIGLAEEWFGEEELFRLLKHYSGLDSEYKIKYHCLLITYIEHQLYKKKRVLCIPKITLNQATCILITNTVAYELCRDDHIRYCADYVIFMHRLLKEPTDVELLLEAGVLTFGSVEDWHLTRFLCEVSEKVVYDRHSYLGSLVAEIQISYKTLERFSSLAGFYFSNDFLTSLFKENGLDVEELDSCCKQVENRTRELIFAGGICSMVFAGSADLVVATVGDPKALDLLNQNVTSNLKPPFVDKLVTNRLKWGNRDHIEATKEENKGGFEQMIFTFLKLYCLCLQPRKSWFLLLTKTLERINNQHILILCLFFAELLSHHYFQLHLNSVLGLSTNGSLQ